MKTKSQIMYAHKKNGILFHFYKDPKIVKFCGDDPIFKVELSEDKTKKSRYFGWWSNKDQEFSMIWPSLFQVEMCSPDAFQSSEKMGEGMITCLNVKELGDYHE